MHFINGNDCFVSLPTGAYGKSLCYGILPQLFLMHLEGRRGVNRPFFGGTVPTFYAKFPTVPIFLDFVPINLNSLMSKNSAILSPNLVILTILNILA